jgi:hypothetical protein
VVLGGSSAALSGWDALRLHGLCREPPVGESVLVLVRGGRSHSVGPVRIRQTDRPFASQLTSFEHPLLPLTPLVGPARAVADTAISEADLDRVRSFVARAVQQGACTPDQLAVELQQGPRNGSGHLRRALFEIAAGARSAAEASAFDQLCSSRLPDFELNVPVVDATGTVVYVIDVLWRRLRAALEIDSREFHFGLDEWRSTMTRHNTLTTAALSIVHYPPSRFMHGDRSWLGELERWLRARAGEVGVAYVVGSPKRTPPIATPAPLCLPSLAKP